MLPVLSATADQIYACLVSKTSIIEGASVMEPLSAIEIPRASPFSTSARVSTRQKTGPLADAEQIPIVTKREKRESTTSRVLRMLVFQIPKIVLQTAKYAKHAKISDLIFFAYFAYFAVKPM